MSKPVKTLLRKELVAKLSGQNSLAVVSLAGVNGVANNKLRRELRKKNISLRVVNNAVARQALKELGLDPAIGLVEGPCALAVGGDSAVTIVRTLLAQGKDMPSMVVRGALMEGEVFAAEKVQELSQYPTRDEAIAGVVMLAKAPGARLAACFAGPGSVLAAIIKAVEEKAKELQAKLAAEKPPEAPAAEKPAEAAAETPAEAPAPAAETPAEAPAPAAETPTPAPEAKAEQAPPASEAPKAEG